MQKIPNKFFFRIGEVSKLTSVEPHVLRYWETEFKSLRPKKNKAGQRVYKKKDVLLILSIKELLYKQKYTIAGAKKRIEAEQYSNNYKMLWDIIEEMTLLNFELLKSKGKVVDD